MVMGALAVVIAKPVIAEHNIDCNAAYNIKVFAQCEVTQNWDSDQWKAFEYIIQSESGWTHNKAHYADYPERSATGLAGFLDSTWSTVDCKRTYDKREQIRCGIKYIEKNFQTPQIAKTFHSCVGICYDPRTGGTIKKKTTWY